jgi:hypothetical protein
MRGWITESVQITSFCLTCRGAFLYMRGQINLFGHAHFLPYFDRLIEAADP